MLALAFWLMAATPSPAVSNDGGEVYWTGGLIAVQKRRSIEFYRTPKGARVFAGGSSAPAQPLASAVLPRGPIIFRREKEDVSVEPVKIRRFDADLLPSGHASGRRRAFLVCSSNVKDFCGAMDVSGRDIFQVSPRPSGGTLEPAGITEDGAEALFTIVGPGPRHEALGYLVRSKSGTQRTANVQDPDVMRLLKRFQGPAVLPEP